MKYFKFIKVTCYIIINQSKNNIKKSFCVLSGVRLVGGDSTSGRVEIFYHGVWGTVCDDDFASNNNAARVVCAMLGKNT